MYDIESSFVIYIREKKFSVKCTKVESVSIILTGVIFEVYDFENRFVQCIRREISPRSVRNSKMLRVLCCTKYFSGVSENRICLVYFYARFFFGSDVPKSQTSRHYISRVEKYSAKLYETTPGGVYYREGEKDSRAMSQLWRCLYRK